MMRKVGYIDELNLQELKYTMVTKLLSPILNDQLKVFRNTEKRRSRQRPGVIEDTVLARI
jgi:hypothetical protein